MVGIANAFWTRPARKPVSTPAIGRTARRFNASAHPFFVRNSFSSPRLHDPHDSLSKHRSGFSSLRPGPTPLVWADVYAVVHHRLFCPAPVCKVQKAEHVDGRSIRFALLFDPRRHDRWTAGLR